MINQENKLQYGELFTPKHLVIEMLDLIPKNCFKNKNLKWLDPGCGKGEFIKEVFSRLFQNLFHETRLGLRETKLRLEELSSRGGEFLMCSPRGQESS